MFCLSILHYRFINTFKKKKYIFLQWDVQYNVKAVEEIQRIPNGTNPGNFTSIIRVLSIFNHTKRQKNEINMFLNTIFTLEKDLAKLNTL